MAVVSPDYVGFVTSSGFVVPTVTIRARFGKSLKAFLAKLVIITPVKVGKPKRAEMYSWSVVAGVPCLCLPRGLISRLLSGRILTRIEVALPLCQPAGPIPLLGELFDNQAILVERIMADLTPEAADRGTATCILNLRAGMGKTFVAAGLISRVGVRALYIVPKRPLAVQTTKDLSALLGAENVEGPRAEKRTDRLARAKTDPIVTVLVINSALTRPLPAFDLVIFDEVHMYCSEKRRAIFKRASARYMVGMSATTEDRTDGFDPIAHKELARGGNVDGIIRAEDVPGFTYEDVVFDCHARIIKYAGPPEHTQVLRHESTGYVFTHYMHNQFIGDPYRLRLAMRELVDLYDWRGIGSDGLPAMHYIYVFAEEIDILRVAMDAIAGILRDRGRDDIVADLGVDLDSDGLRMFTGGLKDSAIGEVATHGRVLFSTYGYGGTGISIAKMSATILLTPRMAAMKQIIPRILRRGSDQAIPRVVVDIVDSNSCLKHQAGPRRLALEFYGFKLNNIQVDWKTLE